MSLLNTHYRDNHPPLICKQCDKEFVTPNGLEHHSYPHKILKFKCSSCDAKFPFQSSLESHLLTHSGEKKHWCVHKGCNKSFYSKGDLTKYSKVHLDMVWKCTPCDYSSKGERNLKAHHRKHSHLKRYMCNSCMKLFKYHTQLKRHTLCTGPPSLKDEEVEPKLKLKCSDSTEY